MSIMDLTEGQRVSLRFQLDCHSIDVANGLSDGAWLASMMEAVEVWCDSQSSDWGLGGLILVDSHEAVMYWLDLGGS